MNFYSLLVSTSLLVDTMEAINKGVFRMNQIIKSMESHGYYYDKLESHKGSIRFTFTGMISPLVFKTWNEVSAYLKECIFE
jgi:hypothetical protein